MQWTLAALVATAAPAWAELNFEDIQACYGRLGPERKSMTFYPLDEVLFRYNITGVRVNNEGRVDGGLTLQVRDAAGKLVLNNKSSVAAVMVLGGTSLPGTANLVLEPGSPPGKYTLSVVYRDNLSGESAQFERVLTLQPEEFAIVSPRFSYDEEGKLPAPAGGLLSQNLHFKLRAIGFDRTQGRIDSDMEVQVLDAAGKPVMPQPIRAQIQNNQPDVVRKAPYLSFSGSLTLNRVGDFTLQITVNDRVGKKMTRFETPLRVRNP
jgi:hypothetical protein